MVKSVRRKSSRKSKSIIRTKSKSIRRKKIMKGGTVMQLKSEGRLTDIGHRTFEKLKVAKYNAAPDSYSATISHNNYILVIEYMLEDSFNQLGMYKIISFDLKLKDKDKDKTLDSEEYIELITNNDKIDSFTIKTREYLG